MGEREGQGMAFKSLAPRSEPEELDPHRQPTGGSQSRGDSRGRGKLPQVETPGAGLFG